MSALKPLRNLIVSLNSNERKTARIYLKTFGNQGNKNPLLRLFDILIKEKIPLKDGEIKTLLYGKSETQTWSRLLFRFQDKILDAICSPENLTRENLFEARTQYVFEIQHQLLRIHFLIERNQPEMANRKIEIVLELTQKINSFELRLIALRFRFDILNRFPEFSSEIDVLKLEEQLFECQITIDKQGLSDLLLYQIDTKLFFGDSLFYQSMLLLADKAQPSHSKALEIDAEQILAYEKGTSRQKPKIAIKHLNSARILLQKNPLVKPSGYKGLIRLKLAEIYLAQHDFRFVRWEVEEGLQFLSSYSVKTIKAYEYLFYGYFYDGKLKEALETLDKLGNLSKEAKPLYSLWRAYTLFALGQFQNVNSILSALKTEPETEISKWAELLLLMNDAEQLEQNPDLEDEVNERLSNLKAKFQASKENTRQSVIMQILLKLHENKLDYKKTFKECSELSVKLNHDENLEWRIQSPELIHFPHWIITKVFGMDRRTGLREIPIPKFG